MECPSYLRGTMMRVTRLNGCGQPRYGDCNQVVSDGFITVQLSPEIEEGEESSVTKANGKTCVAEKAPDQWKWTNTQIDFCQVDPDLVQIINPTWEKILDNQGDTIGFDAIGDLSTDTGFALELWMDVYGESDACTGQEAQGRWGYLLLPWVVGGAPGDLEINNEALTVQFKGRTKLGSRWRRGPYPVVLGENNIPGPLLKPVRPKTQFQLFETTVRPPEAECGCQPVDRPTPERAELVVTGIPNEEPRRTVRLFVDNHGFGPVLIDWGDGGTPEDSIEGRWVTHTYGADGTYPITVSDKQTPAVKVSKPVTVPLPADEPAIKLVCANDPASPLKITARVTMPPQSNGLGTIDWGDGSPVQELDTSNSGGVANLMHVYPAPSIYTVSVRRTDHNQNRFRARDAIQVPCEDDGEAEAPKVCAAPDASDPTGRTVRLTIGEDCPQPGTQVPKVTVSKDTADTTGRTAKVAVDNTTTA